MSDAALRRWPVLVAIPPLVLALLLAAPSTDRRWEDHPSHFWLVLVAAMLSAGLAVATGEPARRRGDARLWLLSLAFLAAAGFLGLHALATPGVLLDTPNAGFVYATPVGLVVAGVLAAASSAVSGDPARAVIAHAGAIRLALLALLLAWALLSLGSVPPLDSRTPVERAGPSLVVLAVAGGACFVVAAWRYLGVLRRRPSGLVLAVVVALILLAEALLATALARNWHLTWWEWHVLITGSIALVAYAAHREPPEERFAALYLDEAAAGRRVVSLLFADAAGFTAFAETRAPDEVKAALDAYLAAAVPAVVRRHGGTIDRLVGDALMATWNTRGDQPDHAARAARAALDVLSETDRIAAGHAGWPRFRVGVNSGPVAVGVLGSGEGRSYTVIGDAVNVANRLQALAPVGGAVIGADTLRAVPGARVRSLGPVEVKGKSRPVEAYVLEGLDESGA
jgi:adenylate cyclase